MSEQLNEAQSPSGEPAAERRFEPSRPDAGVGADGADGRLAEPIFDVRDVHVYYGEHRAVRDISMKIAQHEITALIGPSGCGKSTFIRCLNRMNDLIPGARVDGEVVYHGENLYDRVIDPVQVRKRIGMVFQKPNPFPKSIYDNIAFGPRVVGMKGDTDEIVESALRRAALWDETKDRLKSNAFGMSGGQQQRLCIARALATQPDVLLMDEPCSALDPISTGRIEDLMMELKESYSIVIVTHNMQQAARVSDMTAFFTVELDESAKRRTGVRGRVRRDRQDLHHARGQAHRGLRDGEVRLMLVRVPESHRIHFQEELRRLEEQALGALDLVLTSLDRTLEALEQKDIELAAFVVQDDDRLDGRYLEVHQGILSLLALQAPVAGDLRVVAALLHVIRSAERMGDQCVNIAKLLPLIGHDPPEDPEIVRRIAKMGALARSEVSQAKQAFLLRDEALAEDLVRQDVQVNRLNREIFQQAVETGVDADRREWAMTMMLAARALERIGDNAVDIGEQVAFVVTGLFREFSDASRA